MVVKKSPELSNLVIFEDQACAQLRSNNRIKKRVVSIKIIFYNTALLQFNYTIPSNLASYC